MTKIMMMMMMMMMMLIATCCADEGRVRCCALVVDFPGTCTLSLVNMVLMHIELDQLGLDQLDDGHKEYFDGNDDKV